jgi:hypothetical protein
MAELEYEYEFELVGHDSVIIKQVPRYDKYPYIEGFSKRIVDYLRDEYRYSKNGISPFMPVYVQYNITEEDRKEIKNYEKIIGK